jgi:hypothetical protein
MEIDGRTVRVRRSQRRSREVTGAPERTYVPTRRGWPVAEQAAAGLRTSTAEEVAAAGWLDAEDPAMRQVLAWAMGHDPATAARLAGALGWWWWLRGRLPGQYRLLREVAGRAEVGSDGLV